MAPNNDGDIYIYIYMYMHTSLTLFILFFFFLLLHLLWLYIPTWALTFSILRPQASLFSADLQFLHFNNLLPSLSTPSNHLPLGLPSGFHSPIYPFSTFFGTLYPSSSSLLTRPLESSQYDISGQLHFLV